jgi:hypothetical protein
MTLLCFAESMSDARTCCDSRLCGSVCSLSRSKKARLSVSTLPIPVGGAMAVAADAILNL